MAFAYPDVVTEVRSKIPLGITSETRVLISRFDPEGDEKRRLKWTVPRRRITLNYEFLTQAEIRTLWQFWLDRNGPYQAFNFFHPNVDIYTNEFVGTAEAGDSVLWLPSQGAPIGTAALYRGGTYTSAYNYWESEDPKVPDKATGLNPPADAGERFTWSFTGRLVIQARFDGNEQAMEYIKTYGSGTITLQGLKHKLGGI